FAKGVSGSRPRLGARAPHGFEAVGAPYSDSLPTSDRAATSNRMILRILMNRSVAPSASKCEAPGHRKLSKSFTSVSNARELCVGPRPESARRRRRPAGPCAHADDDALRGLARTPTTAP